MRIMAVAAHPDDVEILCAGTLARLCSAGHDVVIAHFTTGDKGGERDDDPTEVARIRWQEAESSAAVIGATHTGGWFPDLEIHPINEAESAAAALLNDLHPDVVIAHPPTDYHADHRAAARHTLAAVTMLAEAGSQAPELWYMDSMASIDFVPGFFVDIGEVFDTKVQMLEQHRSQVEWMRAHRGLDMTEIVRSTAWFRGMQSGVAHAEAFRLVNGDWPPQPDHPLADQLILPKRNMVRSA